MQRVSLWHWHVSRRDSVRLFADTDRCAVRDEADVAQVARCAALQRAEESVRREAARRAAARRATAIIIHVRGAAARRRLGAGGATERRPARNEITRLETCL